MSLVLETAEVGIAIRVFSVDAHILNSLGVWSSEEEAVGSRLQEWLWRHMKSPPSSIPRITRHSFVPDKDAMLFWMTHPEFPLRRWGEKLDLEQVDGAIEQ